MLAFIPRLLFTSTAIAPVGLVYTYALYEEGKSKAALGTIAVVVVLVVVAHFCLRGIRNSLQKHDLKVRSVETADQENIAFLLLYITPLFTDHVSDLNFQIVIPVAILFIFVVMSGNNYHFNPLLNIMGWHFYKITDPDSVTRVLISKRKIRNIVGDIRVAQITDYVLIEG